MQICNWENGTDGTGIGHVLRELGRCEGAIFRRRRFHYRLYFWGSAVDLE